MAVWVDLIIVPSGSVTDQGCKAFFLLTQGAFNARKFPVAPESKMAELHNFFDNNVANKVSYLNLPPSSEELRSPGVATHDVGFGGCWVVTCLAVSAGSASMLQSNLVAMGPTIVIVFGLAKWATTPALAIGY
jgi:hypothetical protein